MDKGHFKLMLGVMLLLLLLPGLLWAEDPVSTTLGQNQPSPPTTPQSGQPAPIAESLPATAQAPIPVAESPIITPPPPTPLSSPVETVGTPAASAPTALPPSSIPPPPAIPAEAQAPTNPATATAGEVPGPPAATLQSDAAEFQQWLRKNNQQLKQSTAMQSEEESIPPPPTSIPRMPHHASRLPPIPHPSRLVIPAAPCPCGARVMASLPSESPEVISPPLTYKQSQAIMMRSVPKSPPESADSKVAFDLMIQQNVPLSPKQVMRLKQIIDNSQRAAAIPATIPPKPVSSTLIINLAPGATPPAIRLAQGYVSSLVFVDAAGSPWPIASYDIGDPKNMTIQWDGKSNILLMQAAIPYSEGNIVIRLVGLPTPITLEIVSGQRVVDYRTDIHVPGIGPNSKDLPTGTGLPESANQLLLSVLDGVAPPGSRPLTVRGCEAEAWLLGNTMFLRTRFTVLSPGWVGKMSSPDGMIAYEIQKSSSVLISRYGNPVELRIEGF